ncbi:hypothetical protein HYU06_06750 [Candidatus Woesearchaeota archaeon]|nr:hypothetical protein [Candidatus Woesearchaeota archaeon]
MNLTKINQENNLNQNNIIREFHIWDLPDNIHLLLDKNNNELFFRIMYGYFGSQKEFAKFLKVGRQEVYRYYKQIDKDRGKYYPVYLPLKLLKKCKPFLNQILLNSIEENLVELKVKKGHSIYNPKLPIRESGAVYRIIAHMVGDGSAGKGKTPYYSNTCSTLRGQFSNDLKIFGDFKIYERKPNTTETINFTKTVTDILSHLFNVRFTYPNRLPELIFTADRKFKQVFLQALFDDEGTISANLVVTIHNLNIMNGIKSLLTSLNIKTGKVQVHKIPNKTDKVSLSVLSRDYELFQKEIGFAHPEKARKLELAIRTRHRKQRTRDPNDIENAIFNILEIKPSPTIDLANELLFTLNGIKPHLQRMHAEGLLVRKGYKNKIIWEIV